MKTVWFLTLLLMVISQGQSADSQQGSPAAVVPTAISSEGQPVTVVSFKWFRRRQAIEPVAASGPAAAMIPQNQNIERNRRANAPPGERDPNLDTIDGRSAAMERAVQESRAPQPLEGYAYRAKVHNASASAIEFIFWEYQLKDPTAAAPLLRRQFLCGAAIKPGKDKELQAFSLAGPDDVVSVNLLEKKDGGSEAGQVVINRVEFANGAIWQRKDWRFAEVRSSYARALATPWGSEMCRAL